MKITVIITSYNIEQYIADCVRSIALQTLIPYEVILADDASTDNTVQIAQQLLPTIKLKQQKKNRGAFTNTLTALKSAAGDVVCFIDGDDTWPPNKLEKVLQAFLSDANICLVSHRHRRVDQHLKPLNITDATHDNLARIARLDEEDQHQALRRSAIMRLGFWFGSAYCIRLRFLDIYEFESLCINFEDIKFTYLDLVLGPYVIFKNPTARVLYLDNICFDYRVHSTGSAYSKNIQQLELALKRVSSTNQLTKRYLLSIKNDDDIEKRYGLLINEADYLKNLYRRKIFLASKQFINLISYFMKSKTFTKEMIRFVLVMIFGLKFFLFLKSY